MKYVVTSIFTVCYISTKLEPERRKIPGVASVTIAKPYYVVDHSPRTKNILLLSVTNLSVFFPAFTCFQVVVNCVTAAISTNLSNLSTY